MRVLAPTLATACAASANSASLQVDDPAAGMTVQASIVADGGAIIAGYIIAALKLVDLHVLVKLALE